MNRRGFITLLGGAAAWPLAARAQQATPVVGVLDSASANTAALRVTHVRNGLSESGFIVGQNVGIGFRWAEGRYERLPTLANDLVGRRVSVMMSLSLPAAHLVGAQEQRRRHFSDFARCPT